MSGQQQPSAYLVNGRPNPEYAAWVAEVRHQRDDYVTPRIERQNAELRNELMDKTRALQQLVRENARLRDEYAKQGEEVTEMEARLADAEGEIAFLTAERKRLEGEIVQILHIDALRQVAREWRVNGDLPSVQR